MTLKDFKEYFEGFFAETRFKYGISEPFSWRGIYAEVAFSIDKSHMTKEEILRRIDIAYTDSFYGWKGGEYKYNDNTEIHFESDRSSYTDEEYCANIIAEIEGKDPYTSQEERLVKMAFIVD